MTKPNALSTNIKTAAAALLVSSMAFATVGPSASQPNEKTDNTHPSRMVDSHQFDTKSTKETRRRANTGGNAYVQDIESRVQKIGKEARAMKTSQLTKEQKATLSELNSKQREANKKMKKLKTAKASEREERMEELNQSVADLEKLYSQLKTAKMNRRAE